MKRPRKKKTLVDAIPDDLRDTTFAMEQRAEMEKLVDVYNECLEKTTTPKKFFKTHAVKQLNYFAAVAAFARKHGVDPAAWIFTVFAQLGWRTPPPANAFFQVKRLAVVEKLGRSQFEEISSIEVGVETARTDPAAGFQPFRDISAGAELAKRNYLTRGQHELCILQTDLHYGWHARSASCAACPLAQRCREKTEKLAAEYASRAGDHRYKR